MDLSKAPPSRRKEPVRIFIIEPRDKASLATATFTEPEDLWVEIACSTDRHPGLQPIGRSQGVPDETTLNEKLEESKFTRDARRELIDHVDAIILQPTADGAEDIFADCLLIRTIFPPSVSIIIETETWDDPTERALYEGNFVYGFRPRDYKKLFQILENLYRAKNP